MSLNDSTLEGDFFNTHKAHSTGYQPLTNKAKSKKENENERSKTTRNS